ncbi:hypothetical protein WJX73_004090 [Symbiochloris irregularis]|uniref:EamA domain-containing protein n=1 Tax=Symbiochloris irregularis TaxID=706552 RepID=A0AAW1PZQ1_9CHLO
MDFSEVCSRVQGLIWNNGLASIAGASLIMGINALLVKLVVARVPVFEIVVGRAVLSWTLSVTVGKIQGQARLYGQRKNYIPMLVRSTTGSASMALYYYGLLYLPLADTVTLLFMNPVLVCLLAWVLLGEHMGLLGIAGVVGSFLGVVLVSQPPVLFGGSDSVPWTPQHMTGVLASIGAAFMVACAFVSIRFMSGESALSIALWFHTCSIFVGIVPTVVGWPSPAVVPSAQDALIMVFVGVTSFVGQVLLGRGYQLEVASKVAAVNYLQVVFASFFGIVFLGERLTLLAILGSILIAMGVVLANMGKAKKPASDSAQPSSVKAEGYHELEMQEEGGIQREASGHLLPKPSQLGSGQ